MTATRTTTEPKPTTSHHYCDKCDFSWTSKGAVKACPNCTRPAAK